MPLPHRHAHTHTHDQQAKQHTHSPAADMASRSFEKISSQALHLAQDAKMLGTSLLPLVYYSRALLLSHTLPL